MQTLNNLIVQKSRLFGFGPLKNDMDPEPEGSCNSLDCKQWIACKYFANILQIFCLDGPRYRIVERNALLVLESKVLII